MRILIKNGRIITSEEDFFGSILIEDEKILSITPGNLSNISSIDKIIDASGKFLIPGGIDPHVHMHLLTPAGFSSDDFFSGSRAALMGGTTSIIDFVTPQKGQNLIDALEQRKKEAENCMTDYSFHVSPIEWRPSLQEEINTLKNKEGISSFKVYMAYKKSIGIDDDVLNKVLDIVAKSGGMVTVHSELGDEIDALRSRFVKEGKTEPEYHPLSRPSKMESEAVKKVISFAKDKKCPLYIVHVSTADAMYHIKNAREKGQIVYGETCPQYLLLDDRRYQGSFESAVPYIMSPPLRSKKDNMELWKGLKAGYLQTTGTDHCPFTMKQKKTGIYDFTKIPNGAGSVEHRLALLYTYGVLQNKITLKQWVGLTSTNAAGIFGLPARKGNLIKGADADIVIWNPDKEKVISTKNHYMNCDMDIYEGFRVQGEAETVLLRGNIMVENGKWSPSLSKGKFMKRL